MFNKDKNDGKRKGDKSGSNRGDRRTTNDSGAARGKRPRTSSAADMDSGFEKKSYSRPEFGDKTAKPRFSDKSDKPKDREVDRGEFKKRSSSRSDGPAKPYGKREGGYDRQEGGDRKPFGKPEYRDNDRGKFKKRSSDRSDSTAKPYGKREGGYDRQAGDRKPFAKPEYRDNDRGEFKKRSSDRSDGTSKPYEKREGGYDRQAGGDRKPFGKSEFRDKAAGDFKKRSSDRSDAGAKSYGKKEGGYDKKPSFTKSNDRFSKDTDKPTRNNRDRDNDRNAYIDINEGFKRNPSNDDRKPFKAKSTPSAAKSDGLTRLNKYLADAGVASRRKADELISAGEVTVNGNIITELGYKVSREDKVSFNGQPLRKERAVYVLLNKPKDYITTTEDPQERRTVMELVKSASRERIYPVGRLDRNTTGLLVMTNDGELAQKLAHPKHEVTKLYHVTLDKMLKKADFEKILGGLELEDGPVQVDDLAYVEGATKKEVGIEIHSGKNRIVRRIFESLGYEVVKLDRSIYAGLTKKDLPRGRWRYLTEEEIKRLKHFSKL